MSVLADRTDLNPRLAWLIRWRYLVLAGLAVASAIAVAGNRSVEWGFFLQGSELIFHRHAGGGLHTYANHHELQIGPLTFLIVTALRVFGDDGSRRAAVALMVAGGPGLIWMLEQIAGRFHGRADEDEVFHRQLSVLLGGALVVMFWAYVAVHFVHIDDVLALTFAGGAMWAVTDKRPVIVGVMIGLAVAAKPWAIILLPVVLVFPWRQRIRALAGVAVGMLPWLPFVLADLGTLKAGSAEVDTRSESVLHLFGVAIGSTPGWVRPAQLAAALILGVIVVRLGRWPAVLLVGITVRVLLDPAVFGYYTSGLLLAALAWDLMRSRKPLPVYTGWVFWLLGGVALVLTDRGLGVLRLVACVGVLGAVLRLKRGPRAAQTA